MNAGRMETRSSPAMHQLQSQATERGLDAFEHLSKPQLFHLLQTTCSATTPQVPTSQPTSSCGSSGTPPSTPLSTMVTKRNSKKRKATFSSTKGRRRKSNLSVVSQRSESSNSKNSTGRSSGKHSSAKSGAASCSTFSGCGDNCKKRRAWTWKCELGQVVLHKKRRVQIHDNDNKANDHDHKNENLPKGSGGDTMTPPTISPPHKNKERATRQGPTNPFAKGPVNSLDPIMLTELGEHTFEFERCNGSIVSYNIDSLVQYLLKTGDFSEPETRIPFSDKDLERMDHIAKAAKLKEKSVMEAKRNHKQFEEQKIKRDGLLGLERCAGDCITSMMKVVECDDPEEGQIELLTSLFPSFASLYEQMRSQDKEFAHQCMNHFLDYLEGPPNRPTNDESGLLSVILDFLKQVASGRQHHSAFGF